MLAISLRGAMSRVPSTKKSRTGWRSGRRWVVTNPCRHSQMALTNDSHYRRPPKSKPLKCAAFKHFNPNALSPTNFALPATELRTSSDLISHVCRPIFAHSATEQTELGNNFNGLSAFPTGLTYLTVSNLFNITATLPQGTGV